ncbi:MAG: response regulator transcription factor, partial [Gammaproteobacteria bacterium]|nr:response regulator transcription factor [Gammaproteobacteria bacterium]
MLHLSQYGIRAYFNSYMADTHYRQMLHLLEAGQTWFVPSLLAKALELARLNSALSSPKPELDQLTPRERDVALAVARGMSNKRIAATLDISERTVKTHLTRV